MQVVDHVATTYSENAMECDFAENNKSHSNDKVRKSSISEMDCQETTGDHDMAHLPRDPEKIE